VKKIAITTTLALVASLATAQQPDSGITVTDLTLMRFWRNGQPLDHLSLGMTKGVSLSIFGWNTPSPNPWVDYRVWSEQQGMLSYEAGASASVKLGRGTGGAWLSPTLTNGRLKLSGMGYFLVSDRGVTSVFVPNTRLSYSVDQVSIGLELTGFSDTAGWHQRLGPTVQWKVNKTDSVRLSFLKGSGGTEVRLFYKLGF